MQVFMLMLNGKSCRLWAKCCLCLTLARLHIESMGLRACKCCTYMLCSSQFCHAAWLSIEVAVRTALLLRITGSFLPSLMCHQDVVGCCSGNTAKSVDLSKCCFALTGLLACKGWRLTPYSAVSLSTKWLPIEASLCCVCPCMGIHSQFHRFN